MDHRSALLGLEIIVGDVDRAVALFVDVLGFSLHERGPASLVSGESAIVTDGTVAITLLCPTTDGDAPILPDRRARFSQIVLAVAPDAIDGARESVVEAGLSMTPTGDGFFIGPEVVEGALGVAAAVVVVPEP